MINREERERERVSVEKNYTCSSMHDIQRFTNAQTQTHTHTWAFPRLARHVFSTATMAGFHVCMYVLYLYIRRYVDGYVPRAQVTPSRTRPPSCQASIQAFVRVLGLVRQLTRERRRWPTTSQKTRPQGVISPLTL